MSILSRKKQRRSKAMERKHTESTVRRVRKIRSKILRRRDTHRICVHKTPRHIYAQLIAPGGGKTLAAASTVGKSFTKSGDKKVAAKKVGEELAKKAKKCGVNSVAFDRSGFKYHGRIKSLADGMRDNGIKF